MILLPNHVERSRRRLSTRSASTAMIPLENWAISSELSRYPFLEYPASFDAAISDYDWQPARNPYSGLPVRCVEPGHPSPGDFSYLTRASFVKYADGSTREGLGGYVLVVWGLRALPEDLRTRGHSLRLPIAGIISSGSNVHWTKEAFGSPAPVEEYLETAKEAFSRAGLGEMPPAGGSSAPRQRP
ncbi:hypothetical protein IT575_12750 [bacterium]|nr:hypothetical protein [bacterium]